MSKSSTITTEAPAPRTIAPVHPGEMLREDFLEPLGLTAYALAKACHVPRTRIERILRKETAVSAETALRLGRYFGMIAQFWMNVQAHYDVETARDRVGADIAAIVPRNGRQAAEQILPSHIALLRAVNVGKRKVPMAELKTLALGIGLEEISTLLQSGNLIFRTARQDIDALEGELERAGSERFGFVAEYMLRDAREWRAVIDGNPFADMAASDPGHLVVLALKKAPKEGGLAALRTAIKGPERVELMGRNAYLCYPEGIGRSKLTNALLEKHLGPCTGRNWNTVLKLMALLES